MTKKKVLGVPFPIVAILLTIVLVGTVTAAILVTKTVPGTITIKAHGDIELFEDSACTIPLTELAPFELFRGDPMDGDNYLEFYVKNVGDEDVWCYVESSDLPTGVTLEFCSVGSIGPGIENAELVTTTKRAKFTIVADETAPRGTFSWTLDVIGCDADPSP